MKMHETYSKKINNTIKYVLFCIQNQGWKIAFGSIGVQKTMTFDGFAKKTRIANPQIAAISNRAILNRVMRILNR